MTYRLLLKPAPANSYFPDINNYAGVDYTARHNPLRARLAAVHLYPDYFNYKSTVS